MKRTIITSAMILLTVLLASGVYAWNCGGMYSNGMYSNGYNETGYSQSFYNDTASLRSSMAADRAELNALMLGANPDPARARVLSEKISKAADELRLKAQKYHIAHNMGPGMMNGYGGGWGRGMMARHHNTSAGCWQ